MEIRELQPTSYESPHVVDYGDLVELTAGDSTGDCTDATFPAGTNKDALTFSSC